MKMRHLLFLLLLVSKLFSQTPAWVPGTVCSTCIVQQNSGNPKGGPDPNLTVMNGNGTLAVSYTNTACGLGYVQASRKLGRRNPLNGAVQPAQFTITGIPACAIIEQAWVYFGGVSNASTAVNVTIVNPQSVGGVYPAQMIGQHVSMCWGYSGTRNYRANVTPQITGNGVYTISGIPTNPPIAGQDMNGATLLIVYRDPLQLWTGNIVIGDGCQVGVGGTQQGNIFGFTSCAASTSANAFYMVADMQNVGVFNMKMNNPVNNFVYANGIQDWWDFVSGNATPVTNGQNSFPYGVTSNNDCYDIVAAGLYWQNNCNTCIVTGIANATATSNSPLCSGQTLSLNVVHNATTATTFTWTGPNSFSSTTQSPVFANAQPSVSGVYTVVVEPQGSCVVTRTVQVNVYPTPTITSISNDGPVCQGGTINLLSTSNTSATAQFNWFGPVNFTANTSTTQLINVLPQSSGFYTLQVINTYTGSAYTQTAQCQTFATTSVAVVPVASLQITPFFTLCQNSNLLLTASAQGATSYNWVGPNSFTSSLQNPIINNVSPINSGDYSVSASYISPITTLICTSNAVSNVSVVPRNPVNAFSSVNVCQGSVGSFSANSQGSSGYQWFGPNGFTSTLQINSITNIQPVSSGNYSVLALFSIGSVTCSTTNFIPLNVVGVPSIAVSPPQTICQGENVSISASAVSAINWLWQGPNNFSLTNTSNLFTNSTSSISGVYTVSAQFTNGNLTCNNSTTTTILVKPKLKFELGDRKLLCFGSNLQLTGPAGATSYNWSGPFVGNWQSQVLFLQNLNSGNTGFYSLEVDLNGCKTRDTIRVDVLSPIQYTNVPGNLTLCKGQPVNFTASSAFGSGNYAYVWTPFNGITGPTGSVQAGFAQGTTIYNIQSWDIACPDYKINHEFTLTVLQPPQPNLSISQLNGCEPLCVTLDSKLLNYSDVTYNFGENVTTSGKDPVTVCLPRGRWTPTITTIGTNGCSGVFEMTTSIITVFPKPNSYFNWTPNQPTTTDGNVQFFPTVSGGNNFTYFWQLTKSFDRIDTTWIKNPISKYEDNGKFPVILVTENEFGCKDTTLRILVIDEDVSIFIPNSFSPNDDDVNDYFNVFGVGLTNKNFSLEIFDRWGELIFRSSEINKGWNGTFKGVKCKEDVYVYKAFVTDVKGRIWERTGHVTLMK
jgi:gliding motility-associated-like protein